MSAALLSEPFKQKLRICREKLLLLSLQAAIREQGLAEAMAELERIVPDLSKHYTSFNVDSEFLRTKVRWQHAFQVGLARRGTQGAAVVADIGDSSGTHTVYLKAQDGEQKRRYLSVNLDENAVNKIRARGLEAVHDRAENLCARGIDADAFLCFETLEHLHDPFTFLHSLSVKTRAKRLVLSVPFVRQSRVGLHHIRAGLREKFSAERVHIFELSPDDLRLAFKHCGWKLVYDEVRLQYPLYSPLRAARGLWKKLDFEGFYGAVLEPDRSWADLYLDWPG